jgi:Raf kinase inhibitor-like YbhB/YbcL family protein
MPTFTFANNNGFDVQFYSITAGVLRVLGDVTRESRKTLVLDLPSVPAGTELTFRSKQAGSSITIDAYRTTGDDSQTHTIRDVSTRLSIRNSTASPVFVSTTNPLGAAWIEEAAETLLPNAKKEVYDPLGVLRYQDCTGKVWRIKDSAGAVLKTYLPTAANHQEIEITSTLVPMALTSTAFVYGGQIPSKYTCEGEAGVTDVSPPLAWERVPSDARSLVLIMDDPDAGREAWVHWVVYNIPPNTKSLPENAGRAGLPQGALHGLTDWASPDPSDPSAPPDPRATRYGGPCPPTGESHHYFLKLYALDIVLNLRDATKSKIEQAMGGHERANAELIGTYRKYKGDR